VIRIFKVAALRSSPQRYWPTGHRIILARVERLVLMGRNRDGAARRAGHVGAIG
jgi:hypothetical protein